MTAFFPPLLTPPPPIESIVGMSAALYVLHVSMDVLAAGLLTSRSAIPLVIAWSSPVVWVWATNAPSCRTFQLQFHKFS